jgi:SOS response regulatory protein OraA/RecX
VLCACSRIASIRARSCHGKIAPLAESAEQLAALLDDLTASDLLSDERYASARINSRAGALVTRDWRMNCG